MKKNTLFIAAFFAAALVSCAPNELMIEEPGTEDAILESPELIHITIKASMDEATRAGISTSDRSWTWDASDLLAVFDGSPAIRQFNIKEILSDGQAIFEGDVASTESLTAVFPYSAATSEGGYILSSSQTITSGQAVDPAAMVATATGEKIADSDFSFYFTPVVSFFKLNVGTGTDKVILHAVAKEEAIAGESRSLDVTVPGEGTYWAVVNPLEYNGIRAFAHSTDGWTIKAADSAVIDLSKAGSGKNLGTVSGGSAVAVICKGADLVSYLGSNPTLDAYIASDLDLSGKTITSCSSFANVFDGQWHSIHNWVSNATALFTSVSSGAEIKNFTLEGSCNLTFPDVLSNFGFVAASNSGKLSNITVGKASVTVPVIGSTASANGYFGVIAGNSSGTSSEISACVTDAEITYSGAGLVSDKNLYFGAVTGRTNGKIENCSNSGAIVFTYTDATMTKCLYAAGICGNAAANAEISNCSNTGNIAIVTPGSGNDCLFVCGIVGYCSGTITNCDNEGAISLFSESKVEAADGPFKRAVAAGVVGYVAKSVSNCNNAGPVTLRGGYVTGSAAVGSITTVATVAAGIAGVTYDANVSGCSNSAAVTSTLGNIQSSYFTTSSEGWAQANLGGIVGINQGTISECENMSSATVAARWVTASHSAALGERFLAHVGGITAGSSNAVDKTKSSITDSNNYGAVSMTFDASSANSTLGGIVGWPGSESGQTGSISRCISSAVITVDGFGKGRVGGISGGTGIISDCTVSGKINVPGKVTGSYIGGISGYVSPVYTISGCSVDGLAINYTNATGMNSVLYGIGGLAGHLFNSGDYSFGPGCSVLVSITSNHCRDTGFLAGRIQDTAKNGTFGTSESRITIRNGCCIANTTTGNTVSVDSADKLAWKVSGVAETQGTSGGVNINYAYGGFLVGSLNLIGSNASRQDNLTMNLSYAAE